jgi:hypothetical protein
MAWTPTAITELRNGAISEGQRYIKVSSVCSAASHRSGSVLETDFNICGTKLFRAGAIFCGVYRATAAIRVMFVF